MKIGIFSTFIEPAALELVQAVKTSVKKGEIPNTEIAFIFSNRALGEFPTTDSILQQLTQEEIPLITFSAKRFKPELRNQAKKEEIRGDSSFMQEWRNQFGDKVSKLIPKTDLDLLLGDMYVWGENMCRTRNGINLHPALPNGPTGEWYNVIWDLIQKQATETGVMMHKVTPELDRGPAIAFCRFPIRGYPFDVSWNQLPQDQEELERLVKKELLEKERTSHPLHKKIREHGLAREFPLIINTTKSFAEGQLRIEGAFVIDSEGRQLKDGFDLTRQIDETVKPVLEGAFSTQKEKQR